MSLWGETLERFLNPPRRLRKPLPVPESSYWLFTTQFLKPAKNHQILKIRLYVDVHCVILPSFLYFRKFSQQNVEKGKKKKMEVLRLALLMLLFQPLLKSTWWWGHPAMPNPAPST